MWLSMCCATHNSSRKKPQFSPLAASLCDWGKLRTPLQMPYAVSRSRECPYLPGRLPLSYLEVVEKKATFLMFKEIGNWSGRLLRQGCLQTKKHGENGNALKGGGKKGGNGSIWDWMEKESLGLSHINGLPPKPFLLQTATAAPASPGADNSHAEGLKLGTFIRDPLAWLRPRRERVRMSLGLAVSHPRGTKKLEEVSTLKTSPGA